MSVHVRLARLAARPAPLAVRLGGARARQVRSVVRQVVVPVPQVAVAAVVYAAAVAVVDVPALP